MQFEFIDYDGGYPNLCFGRLKFKADGKIYEEVVSLISGGSVWFDSHWCEHVEEGPWLDICDFSQVCERSSQWCELRYSQVQTAH